MGNEIELQRKQASLHEKGMSLMEKKAIRTVLSNMGSIALWMGCNVRSCIINFQVKKGVKADLGDTEFICFISNSENKNTVDATENIDKLKEDNWLLEVFAERMIEVIDEMAAYWNTPHENILFQAWTDSKEDKIKAHIKPKEGFEAYEVIDLSGESE